MILITGIPRSGTEFLCSIIREFGMGLEKKIFCSPKDSAWSSIECPAIGQFMDSNTNPFVINDLLHAMEKYWSDIKFDEFVYKNPRMVFLEQFLLHNFSLIVICTRQEEDWEISARNYKDVGNLIETIDHHRFFNDHERGAIKEHDNKYSTLYTYWRLRSFDCIDFCINNRMNYVHYKFGNDEDLVEFCNKIGLKDVDAARKLWNRKSPHSSSYLDNLNNK